MYAPVSPYSKTFSLWSMGHPVIFWHFPLVFVSISAIVDLAHLQTLTQNLDPGTLKMKRKNFSICVALPADN